MSLEAVRAEVEPIRSLREALRWAHARSPRAEFLNAVAQDEFTHDVVVRAAPDVFVVFDTT